MKQTNQTKKTKPTLNIGKYSENKSKSLAEKLLNLLYPPRCGVCEKLLDGETNKALCPGCLKKFNSEICFFQKEERHNYYQPDYSDGIISLTAYKKNSRSVGKKLIYKAKNKRICHIYDFSAERISELIKKEVTEFDGIVYAPRSITKYAQTGIDQSFEISKRIAKILNTEFLDIIRNTGRIPQKNLSFNERLRNARESLKLKTDAEKYIKGKKILLYDDIITTGATLSAASYLLKTAGAEKVFCVTSARSIGNNKIYRYTHRNS